MKQGPGKLGAELRLFYKKNQQYVAESKAEIAEKNCETLKRAGLCYTLLLLAYAVMASFIFKEASLNLLYAAFLAIQIVYDFLAVTILFKGNGEYKVVQLFCTVFCILVMSFIILVSVYPFPKRPGIFFPIILMAIPVLFIFSYGKLVVLQFVFTTAFLLLAFISKSHTAFSYDICAAVTAMIISLACAYIIVDLRLRENKIKLQLEELSTMDMLTGLLNKGTAEKHCEEYLKEQKQGVQCVLFMIDIDHFKDVNDRGGHKKGDDILHCTGKALQQIFRKEDILGRAGGDEFIVLMKDTQDASRIKEKADGIMNAFSAPEAGGVTCSVGAALCKNKVTSFDAMYLLADKALYEAKETGRNKIVILEL